MTTLSPIRIPELVLAAARRKAKARDETISAVVRRALRAYAETPVQTSLEEAIEDAKRRAR